MQQALIFDMDGTMVDNMMTHHRGWQKTLKQYGLDFSLEEVMSQCHGKNVEIIERLFPGKYTVDERERISFEKESGYRGIFLPELKLVNGLPEILEMARKSGIPMGIGTAAPKANVDFVLDNLDIRHYFQAIVHAEDVDKGKPDPGVFFKVADLLGIAYGDCLVFEDSPTGAKTAFNAGMKAIILTTTHQEYEFEGIASVIRCVPDYTHINLLSLLETFKQP
jgi:HAD superfamily hydrolase (TIGR01509 family)